MYLQIFVTGSFRCRSVDNQAVAAGTGGESRQLGNEIQGEAALKRRKEDFELVALEGGL